MSRFSSRSEDVLKISHKYKHLFGYVCIYDSLKEPGEPALLVILFQIYIFRFYIHMLKACRFLKAMCFGCPLLVFQALIHSCSRLTSCKFVVLFLLS